MIILESKCTLFDQSNTKFNLILDLHSAPAAAVNNFLNTAATAAGSWEV